MTSAESLDGMMKRSEELLQSYDGLEDQVMQWAIFRTYHPSSLPRDMLFVTTDLKVFEPFKQLWIDLLLVI